MMSTFESVTKSLTGKIESKRSRYDPNFLKNALYLKSLETLCRKYTEDSDCVYKMCGDFLVIMRKLEISLTNEDREGVVDADHAEFKANVLKVELIIDVTNFFNQPHHIFYNLYAPVIMEFKVGETVYNNARADFQQVHKATMINDHEIEYFKTLETAYFKRDEKSCFKKEKFYVFWNEDGSIVHTIRIDNPDFMITEIYDPDGTVRSKYRTTPNSYGTGEFYVHEIYFYKDGKKSSEEVRINATHRNEICKNWHKNGNLRQFYIAISPDGYRVPKKIGVVSEYYSNGKKRRELLYSNEGIVQNVSWNENGDRCDPLDDNYEYE